MFNYVFIWLILCLGNFIEVVMVNFKFINFFERKVCFKVKIMVLKCYCVCFNSGFVEVGGVVEVVGKFNNLIFYFIKLLYIFYNDVFFCLVDFEFI